MLNNLNTSLFVIGLSSLTGQAPIFNLSLIDASQVAHL